MAREQHQSKLEMEMTTLVGRSLRDALVVRWRLARLFRMSPDRLEGYVLWTTIPWFWRWLALVMVWNSNWLREDRKLIASCLSTTSLEDCLLEVENHYFRRQMGASFVARFLRFRVSGRRLIRLARIAFPEE